MCCESFVHHFEAKSDYDASCAILEFRKQIFINQKNYLNSRRGSCELLIALHASTKIFVNKKSSDNEIGRRCSASNVRKGKIHDGR